MVAPRNRRPSGKKRPADPRSQKMTRRGRKTLPHLLSYLLLRTIVAIVSAPPRPLARRLGRLLGRLVFLLGIRRAVVLDNLRVAFSERSESWRSRTALRCYEHFGEVLADLAGLNRWSDRELRERTAYENRPLLEEAIGRGRGVVVATGHIGGIDAGPARLAFDGHQVLSVFQGVHNPYVEEFITRIRSCRGATVARRGIGMRKAFSVLKKKGLVMILADQDAGPNGLFLPFFGRDASTLIGPAELALRTGAVLLVGFVILEKNTYRLVADRIIENSSLERMMQEYNEALEEMIRRYPEQYFWLHKRWKTPPPNRRRPSRSAAE
ncbi:MAG: hypothetical protein D6679_05055 [Candidatus Hydrogenedentota bacterium]|nr:MAG: hypothetical protein D6679_05055 [Candidatus Hydrogenedentota bacterium]